MISSLLWRIWSWIRSKALWVTIGLIVLIALIWYIGPLFAFGDYRPLESARARYWCIGILLGFVLLRWLIKRWRVSKLNGRMADMFRGALSKESAATAQPDANIDKLEETFGEALDILRKARFEQSSGASFLGRIMRRKRYVYELPWYAIIGAPGAGKTTALVNSGLSFPLAKQFGNAAVRGSGGTRHCDWWFTNEAVFIDTAGRYTTHDSDSQADKAEWQGFLSLLKKNRPQQPINGVVVTLSVAELLQQNAQERATHAGVIRARLEELRAGLGVSFPVYVLVTKCDLLFGFDEYFADLDRAGREQVWGLTLPLPASRQFQLDQAQIKQEMDLLCTRIYDGLVDRLQAEPDLNHRGRIFGFPQEFGAIAALVESTVTHIFVDSRFAKAPLLRGIYFTSGTQEGAPFDRIISSMEAAGEARHKPRTEAGSGKSFFLHELLTKVVFPEAYIVGSDPKAERRARATHIAVYALCLLLLAAAVTAWAISYRNNQTYIAEVDHKGDSFASTLPALPAQVDSNLYALLPYLNAAEQLPDSAQFKVSQPLWPWTFGLYQGEKINAASKPLYDALLTQRFAPTIKKRLEQLLRTVAVDDLEFAFEILKAYVMMHEPQHFKADAFVAFMLADWDYNMPQGAGQAERQAIEKHVRALIAIDGVLPTTLMDAALVDATRARLSQYSISQRIYRRLSRLLDNNRLPVFSVAAQVGPQAPRVFRRVSNQSLTDGVASLYTYRGYHELFDKEVERAVRSAGEDDSWILGVSESQAKDRLKAIASGELALEVRRLYMWDYVAKWEQYLDDVVLVEPSNLAEAAELASMLSSPDSPLMRYMQAVVQETQLSQVNKESSSDRSLLDRARRSVQATHEDINRIVGPSAMPAELSPQERPELIVDNRFEALRKAVGTADDKSAAPLLMAAQSFGELHMYLAAAEAARVGGYPPPESDLPNRLRSQAARLPQPSKKLLETLADNSRQLVVRETRRAKSNELVGMVTRACRDAIQGRYPLVRNATREVAPDDFTRIFGPGGRMDEYFQRELASYVDISAKPWRLREGAQGGLGGGVAIAAFEQASVIKDVFFRGGSGAPKITLAIKPMVMDSTITTMTLDVDGQIVRYQHGPNVSHTVSWPGTRGSNQVRLSFEPPLPQGASGVVTEGAWALHRLFDQAQILPGASPERFTAELDVGGRKVRFEITASSIKNPFRLQELTGFVCPSGL
ncbi:type VI secretion system membrane subunit TssM [Lampropedia aestuarii]|uniref:Type VI secretion system membrane subunit TssM n=1 Tax=Lampropedia aestuarii TaxID=2562762 RepID=A0A4S5BMW0_9BURK|nr:type VI secretion system membrane subunit TssM [Lampropedia aestuarii]THJ31068.1 type VI secretion system membrane subunit TssM [Lampropedia aestuarii]